MNGCCFPSCILAISILLKEFLPLGYPRWRSRCSPRPSEEYNGDHPATHQKRRTRSPSHQERAGASRRSRRSRSHWASDCATVFWAALTTRDRNLRDRCTISKLPMLTTSSNPSILFLFELLSAIFLVSRRDHPTPPPGDSLIEKWSSWDPGSGVFHAGTDIDQKPRSSVSDCRWLYIITLTCLRCSLPLLLLQEPAA